MRVDLFDFDLPEDRIGLRPAEPREGARLLHISPGNAPEWTDACIADLPKLLRRGDLLVFNRTRVLPAQLEGWRDVANGTRTRIGVTLHKRLTSATLGNAPAGSAQRAVIWRAFARPARKLHPGDRVIFGEGLSAIALAKFEGGEVELAFETDGRPFEERLAAFGRMPLPPYIASRRAADEQDDRDYQTIFATEPGAVAAPTAGLHFTPQLLAALDEGGIERAFLTLHVGAGTFLPVKSDDTSAHKMHAEWGEISTQTATQLNAARAEGRRIIAIGTTSLRLLESAADETGRVHPFCGDTAIFITPGYRFRTVDLLLTNFHLPRSTLFMLVAAFSGLGVMQRAYAHAIATGYRFYSYGDACLLSASSNPTVSS
jgi:S-adenosylmethionine:tRNA ribosyltransferase-isomerase